MGELLYLLLNAGYLIRICSHQATLIATAMPAFAKSITGIDIAKSTDCVEKNPDKVVSGDGRMIYSSALLDSKTLIDGIVARCNGRKLLTMIHIKNALQPFPKSQICQNTANTTEKMEN